MAGEARHILFFSTSSKFKNMDILNSEGTIIGIERINANYFIKIKKQINNEYAFFPVSREMLQRYFAGEITTRGLSIPLEEFSFIDDFYTNINEGLKTNRIEEILNNI